MTRRDKCYFVGKRAGLLTPAEAGLAWKVLAEKVEAMGDMDIPKFQQLLSAVRRATIVAKGWDESISRAHP